jgi:hypothetical protein
MPSTKQRPHGTLPLPSSRPNPKGIYPYHPKRNYPTGTSFPSSTNLRAKIRIGIVYLTFPRIWMELHPFFMPYFRFLSLSQHDFVVSTVIDNSPFIEQLFKNYGKGLDKIIHLPSSRILAF